MNTKKCPACGNKISNKAILAGFLDLRMNYGQGEGNSWIRLIACDRCGTVRAISRVQAESLGIEMAEDIARANPKPQKPNVIPMPPSPESN